MKDSKLPIRGFISAMELGILELRKNTLTETKLMPARKTILIIMIPALLFRFGFLTLMAMTLVSSMAI
jgi:hypothetical protein